MIAITIAIFFCLALIVLCRLAYELGKIDGHDEGMEDAFHTFKSFYEEELYAGK